MWAILGVALPLTFGAELHSASMHLRYPELIPLYATDWLCLALVGTLASAFFYGLDVTANAFRFAYLGAISRAAFAMVVGAAIVLGLQAWVGSFSHRFIESKWWHVLIVAVVLILGVGTYFGRFSQTLERLRSISIPITLVGSLSLLSLSWLAFPAALPARGSEMLDRHDRPNIVLISLDALSARHLTAYGSKRPTSPNIDALASRSILFDRFYAVSNFTTTGISTILTGVMPWTHRAVQLLGAPMAASVAQSLPALLHAAGYTTAYFSSNPWAAATREGFGGYFDHRYSEVEWDTAPCLDRLSDRLPYLCAAAANSFVSMVFKSFVAAAAYVHAIDSESYADPAKITEAADRWLEERPSVSPTFMWVHYLPPHDPYAPPPPWLGRFDQSSFARTNSTSHPPYLFQLASMSASKIETLEARYDESIGYVDFYVGRLIADVRATLGPNTAIILTADHGESFAHGYGGHGGVMLYEDLIHIPLMISLPTAEATVARREDLACQSDLAPTIAEIAGITPSPRWDGVPLLNTDHVKDDRTIFAMNFEQNRSVERLATGSVAALNGEWKLTEFLGMPRYPGMPPLEPQLFDISKDPKEEVNVFSAHPDIADRLSKQIDDKLLRFGQPL